MTWFSFGRSRFERAADKYEGMVQAINRLEPEFQALPDDQLRQRIRQYNGRSWEELQPATAEIFAGVREAARRTLNMRHFDVQLVGGLTLLEGNISEMKTGEGKTLVATLPLTFAALTGRGAHLVTVNDYLAQRDAHWMKPIYEFFGLTVGIVIPGMNSADKRAAYAADITYGTNNEFGFDYLRDNMAQTPEDLVQRDLQYAIVDEVDSILIDEARTPLIISAPDTESTKLYEQFSRLVPQLTENTHYNIDEKRRAATLTDEGVSKVEQLLGIQNIYEEKGIRFVHHLEQALRAHTLYKKDKDYVVHEGQIMIIDEFTGRMMHGRRYSEGLHQALEAKEGVRVQQESRTLATITFQNFFRLYERLGGMTGTAVTSAEEFEKVYNLDVVAVPTNKPMVRSDKPDRIYVDEAAKFRAVVEQINERHTKGQPVLVGTIAIEKSEYLSAHLQQAGVKHEVLNAKHHAREAEIIAKAGQPGAVTISTNMAGRGTDIKLGDGVAEKGGLFVLGTERHEARRIDNQLRGRSGRQGDPGETQFFVSLDDDIMRIFGGGRIKRMMERLKLPEDQPIENRFVSKALEGAQERVEGHYFDMRKQVLGYDDVLNRQRQAIYGLRRSILTKNIWKEINKPEHSIHDHILELLGEQTTHVVALHAAGEATEDWNIGEIAETTAALTGEKAADLKAKFMAVVNTPDPEGSRDGLGRILREVLEQHLQAREQEMGKETLARLEQAATLRAIDTHWMDHLDTMDYLRTGIGLRGYGQRDPLVEYQKEGHRLFQELIATIKATLVEIVFKAQAVRQEQVTGEARHEDTLAPHSAPPPAELHGARPPAVSTQLSNPYKNVGRNDPCPCGSGKKFKKCHGSNH